VDKASYVKFFAALEFGQNGRPGSVRDRPVEIATKITRTIEATQYCAEKFATRPAKCRAGEFHIAGWTRKHNRSARIGSRSPLDASLVTARCSPGDPVSAAAVLLVQTIIPRDPRPSREEPRGDGPFDRGGRADRKSQCLTTSSSPPTLFKHPRVFRKTCNFRH